MSDETPREGWSKRTVWMVAVGLFVLSLLVRLPNITGYLETDGVDYVSAARMGYLVNALDIGSQPIAGFLRDCARIYLLKAELHMWRRDKKNNDVAAFRHYHPPFSMNLLGFWIHIFGSSNAALLLLPTIMGSLMAPALYWAWGTLFPTQPRAPGILAGLFAVWDPMLAHTGRFVSAHPLSDLIAFLATVFLARAIRDRRTRDLFIAAGLAGLLFATSEWALVLLASCILVLLLTGNPWVSVTRHGITTSTSVLVAFLVLFVVSLGVWPAGVIRLGLLKGYLLYGGVSIGLFEQASAAAALADFLTSSPVLTLFAAIGLLLAIVPLARRQVPGWLWPLAIFPAMVFLCDMRSAATMPSYWCPIRPSFMLLAGWSLWTVAARCLSRPVAASATVMIVCALVNLPGLASSVKWGTEFWPQAIQFLNQRAVPGDRVFVSSNVHANVLAYYVPELAVDTGYSWPSALEETAQNIRGEQYRFLALIGDDRPTLRSGRTWGPVTGLPYYAVACEKYRLVKTLKSGGSNLRMELFERPPKK